MKLPFVVFVFACALVGFVHSASIAKEARYIGVPLPGLSDLVDGLKKQIRNELDKIPGLTDEQKEALTREFLDQLNQYANDHGVTSVKPSDYANYVVRVLEFAQNVINNIVSKAKDLVKRQLRAVGIPLPGLSDLVDKLRTKLEQELYKITGLTGEQRLKLVQEYMQGLRNFPNSLGIHTVKPSQIEGYLKQIHEYADKMIDALLAKAMELVKINSSPKSAKVNARFLPGLDKVMKFLEKKFDEALYKITGLNKEQHVELFKEFVDQLKQFPVISPWELLSPNAIAEYINRVREFGTNLIDALLAKAKALASSNKNEESRDTRGLLDYLKPFEYMLKELYDRLIGTFLNAIAKINGLTQEQIEELDQKFRNGLDQFPRPPFSELNPLKWVNWSAKLVDHAFALSERLLREARTLAGNILDKLPQQEYDRRDLKLPSFVNNFIDRLVQTFQNVISKVTGLTTEQQEAIVEEFRQKLLEMPLPPLKPWEIINPLKWLTYFKEITAYNIQLTRDLLDKAIKLAQGTLGDDYVPPSIDSLIEGNQEKRDAADNKVETAINTLLDALTYTINNIPGLSDSVKQILIDEIKAEIALFPRPPNNLSVFEWIKFRGKIEAYKAQLTMRLLNRAKDLLKEQVDKYNPELGNLLGKRESPDRVESIFDGLLNAFTIAVNNIPGLSDSIKQLVIDEFKSELDLFPRPPNNLNVFQWMTYRGKVEAYKVQLTLRLLNKARELLKEQVGKINPDLGNLLGKRSMSETYQKRDADNKVETAINTLLDALTYTINNIPGLSDSVKQILIDEIKAEVALFPRPPNNLSVFEWIKFRGKIEAYKAQLTMRLLNRAKDLLKEQVDKYNPELGNLLGKRESPDRVESIFDGLLNAFTIAVNNIPGLSDSIKQLVIDEFKSELDLFPRPPNNLNVFQWMTYRGKVEAYKVQLTLRLLNKARELLKEQVGKINPDLGNLLGKRSLSSMISDLIQQAEENLKAKLAEISGITNEQMDEVIEEFRELARSFPVPQLSDITNIPAYYRKLHDFNLRLSKTLLEKALALVNKKISK